VGPQSDAVETDAVFGRRERRVGRPDLERGCAGREAVDIGGEGIGDVRGSVAPHGDVIAERLLVLERETALGRARSEIAGLQIGALAVARTGNAETGEVIGADIQGAALLVGEYAEHRTAAAVAR